MGGGLPPVYWGRGADEIIPLVLGSCFYREKPRWGCHAFDWEKFISQLRNYVMSHNFGALHPNHFNLRRFGKS